MTAFSSKLCGKALSRFRRAPNREIEELFARTFSGRDDVRLFFAKGNAAWTNGRDIVVDPALWGIFQNARCLENTAATLGWPSLLPLDSWMVLKLVTRGQTLHECLHLMHTNFPGNEFSDPDFADARNARHVLSLVSNIVEDAYVEAVGAAEFENASLYLKFVRVASVHARFATTGSALDEFATPPDMVSGTCRKRGKATPSKDDALREYLNHMIAFLLFPVFKWPPPSSGIAKYVDRTKPLFWKAAALPGPDERYAVCKQILQIIEPLVPADGEIPLEGALPGLPLLGRKSHLDRPAPPGSEGRNGRPQPVSTRLFRNSDGTPKNERSADSAKLDALRQRFRTEAGRGESFGPRPDSCVIRSAPGVGAAPRHKHIAIREFRPRATLRLRGEYRQIRDRCRPDIEASHSAFLLLLQSMAPVWENRFPYGSALDSKRLGDVKQRFWKRAQRGSAPSDLAVLLLLDGSGSMEGSRRDAALEAAVVLHEVLAKQGIEHAVAEHRAPFSEPEMDVTILLDFAARPHDEANIARLSAHEDNRDGLALYWAENYIARKSSCANRLLVVLSDGCPAHDWDSYFGPPANRDTARAARKIAARGTEIVAVALDGGTHGKTVRPLRAIYPNLVVCKDMKCLPGRILQAVLRHLT